MLNSISSYRGLTVSECYLGMSAMTGSAQGKVRLVGRDRSVHDNNMEKGMSAIDFLTAIHPRSIMIFITLLFTDSHFQEFI